MGSSPPLLVFQPLINLSSTTSPISIKLISRDKQASNNPIPVPGESYAEVSNGKYIIKNIMVLVGYIFDKANNKLVNLFDPCASIRGLLVVEDPNKTGLSPNLIIKSEDAEKHLYILSKGNNWRGGTINVFIPLDSQSNISSQIQLESTNIKVCRINNNNQLDIYLNGQCGQGKDVTDNVTNKYVLSYTYYILKES